LLGAEAGGAASATGVPHCFITRVARQIRVGPTFRIVCRSVVRMGTLQVRVTRFPFRVARRSRGGLGRSSDGGCGGAMVAQLMSSHVAGASSRRWESFMRTGTEYQKGSGAPRHALRNRRETGHSRPRLAKAARHGAPMATNLAFAQNPSSFPRPTAQGAVPT